MGAEETGLPGGVPEASLLAALMLMIKLCFGKMSSLEKSVESVHSGLSKLQDRREDDTKALVSTLHEITVTQHKIASQIEAQTKLTERLIDRVGKRD